MERLAVEPTLRLPGGSDDDQQLRREAAMAAELVASGHGDALVRCGVAWLPARTVAELFDHRRTDQDQSRGPEPRPKPSDHGYADIP